MNRGNRRVADSRSAAHRRQRHAGQAGPGRPGPGRWRVNSQRRRATTGRGCTTGALPQLRLDQLPAHRTVRDRLAVLLDDDVAARAGEDTASERAELETLLASELPEFADQRAAISRCGRRARRWSR